MNHRRLNPLTGEWILVSPGRTQRPWQGHVENTPPELRPKYDATCYLCPGNHRAGGHQNPPYSATFAFDNDFPSLLSESQPVASSDLRVAEPERGVCRVICYSPRHDLALSLMTAAQIRCVIDTWSAETARLGALPFIGNVLIFENRGPMAGASNPHPHCQIWATEHLPNEIQKEHDHQQRYLEEHASCLLCNYLELERQSERVVYENDSFIVLVPYWATWPFETLLISKRHVSRLDQLTDEEKSGLAEALREITTRYDNLFDSECPYSMGIHQEPTDGKPHPEWHLHLHINPPLLRSATVRKFMVGFEMFGSPGRDMTPEAAADRLRSIIQKNSF